MADQKGIFWWALVLLLCVYMNESALIPTITPLFCNLPPNVGRCKASFKMYYYDLETNSCQMFIYGGCGGNKNRFSTISECLACYNDSSELIILSTAKSRMPTPKPTTQYRRINVQRKLNDDVSSPLDFLTMIGARRKKGRQSSDIWDWDYWCHLQPKMGNCKKSLNRFYYNTQFGKCLPFLYSGCDGNKNNFNTLDDCERYCEGVAYIRIEDSTEPKFCSLQPNPGFCLALLIRYYYDINEKLCKEFIYGGCGGNQNTFKTIHSCMKVCSGVE